MMGFAHHTLSIDEKRRVEIVKVSSQIHAQKALFFSFYNQKTNDNENEIRFLTSYHDIRLT